MSAPSTESQTRITGSGGVDEPVYPGGAGGAGSGWPAAAESSSAADPLVVSMLKVSQPLSKGAGPCALDATAEVEFAINERQTTAHPTH